MVTEPLITTRLSEPKLRFDYTNRKAVHTSPYDGLREYGPYDAGLRRAERLRPTRVVIVGRADRRTTMETVSEALMAKRLGKLHDFFTLEIVDHILVPQANINREAESYRES